MSKSIHTLYIGIMTLIVVVVTIYLIYTGYSYYGTSLEERFYHPRHTWFKPSGMYGHGLGIFGTLMILFGVSIYIARKRYNFLAKYIRLKYLLEFHIFLCVLGPILILFHTAFKFGGVVSIAFWSMVAVVLSGVIGRFIYIQIPRTIEGRDLSLNEIKNIKTEMTNTLSNEFQLDSSLMLLINRSTDENIPLAKMSIIKKFFEDQKSIRQIKKVLREKSIPKQNRSKILTLVRNEISITNKIGRLETMQKLFKYWHVAHLPFALIMLIIVIIHVIVTLAFGYKWIF